jgi:hypothetical protein
MEQDRDDWNDDVLIMARDGMVPNRDDFWVDPSALLYSSNSRVQLEQSLRSSASFLVDRGLEGPEKREIIIKTDTAKMGQGGSVLGATRYQK